MKRKQHYRHVGQDEHMEQQNPFWLKNERKT